MTKINELANSHSFEQQFEVIENGIVIIKAIDLVRGYENSFSRNAQNQITALSLGNSNIESLELNSEDVALEYLYLSDCKNLKEIKFNVPLPKLTHLYLDGCALNEIVLPDGFLNLEQLYLQNNKLLKITFMGNCEKLQLIDASKNALTEFELKYDFEGLKYLYLNDNKEMVDLNVSYSSALNTLSLKNTKLINLPQNLILSENLKTLYASGNSPKNIPKLFLGDAVSYASYNSIKEARIWFKELADFPSEKNKIVKLMLTGNGNAGKSSILIALKEGKCVHDQGSTHGIDTDVVQVDVIGNSKSSIEFNVWDFGGQEVYHGTHRIFMESEALQVIVFDPETEELARKGTLIKDRDSENEILNHPVEYWYETAYSLSKDSAFIFVQNKSDKFKEEDIKIRDFSKQLNKSDFVQVSAREGTNIKLLRFHLTEGAEGIPDFDMSMPKSWLEVRKYFIDNLKKGECSKKLITKNEFDALCSKSEVNPIAKPLLFKYLHHNGFIYYHSNLGENIIADQRWALEAIYKPLNRKEHNDEFREQLGGKIRVRRLFETFGSAYKINEKWLFLDFMQSCHLCFQLNNSSEREGKHESDIYVFPEFLPKHKPDIVEAFWQNAPKKYYLRFKLQWLNYFIVQSLISNLGRKTKIENIWRNGIHITTPEGCFKIELDFEEKAILVSIEEKAMARWLEPFLEEVKVNDSKNSWEKSSDGKNYADFSLETWKKNKEKGDKTQTEFTHSEEKKPLKEVLVEVEQKIDRQVILFCAANPTSQKISFTKEHTHISGELAEKSLRGKFEIIPQSGTTTDKLIDAINEFKPNIIHFCGHGKEENPETGKGGGLIFHDSDYEGESVIDSTKLNKIFARVKAKHAELSIFLLNACYSEPQAKEVSRNNIYAIGTNDKISSQAARLFAVGFYKRYALTNDIKEAVDNGLTQALFKDEEVETLIHLYHNGAEILI